MDDEYPATSAVPYDELPPRHQGLIDAAGTRYWKAMDRIRALDANGDPGTSAEDDRWAGLVLSGMRWLPAPMDYGCAADTTATDLG